MSARALNNRLVVTAEDVGIFCALLEFVGKHMNEDGTLPWARTKGLWDCLYERGVICRSFNAKRFAWIRRMLERCRSGGHAGSDLRHRGTGGEVVAVGEVLGAGFFP